MVDTKQKKFYEKWSEYGLAMLAFPGYASGKPTDEQQAAASLHIRRTRGLEGILDDARKTGVFDMKRALGADTDQYLHYFHELTVQEALSLVDTTTGYQKGYAPEILKYKDVSLKELAEGTKKYKEALEEYEEAQTEKDALKAFKEKQKYEEIAKVYESIIKFDRQRLLSYYAKDIAKEAIYIHQRDVFDYDKKPKVE